MMDLPEDVAAEVERFHRLSEQQESLRRKLDMGRIGSNKAATFRALIANIEKNIQILFREMPPH